MAAGSTPGRPIRLVAMRRREGLNGEAFQRHWRDVHGPLMAAIPGITYLQNHVAEGPAAAWEVDGFAWIDLPPQPTPTAGAAAAQDLPNFVGASTRLLCCVNDVVPPQANCASKIIQVVHPIDATGRDPRSGEGFASHLGAVLHVPGLAGCRRNVVTGVLPVTEPRIGDLGMRALCVVEAWFADMRIARAALASRPWAIVRDEAAALGYHTDEYLAEEIRIA